MKKIVLLIAFAGIVKSQAQVAFSNPASAPDPSAMLDIKSTSGGLLLPRLTNTNKNAISSPPAGLAIYNTTFNRFEQYDGSAWKPFLNNDFWSRNGNYVYTLNDVGLGTAAPGEKLDVYGNIKLRGDLQLTRYSGTQNNINFRYSGASSNNLVQSFYFKISGDNRAFLQFRHSDAAGEDKFRFGFFSGPYGDIESSGRFVMSAPDNPTIQLRALGVDKAFLQLAGDDFRIGTNSSNRAGQTYFRLNGGNRILLASNGYMKIGSGTPVQRLDVDGDIFISGDINAGGHLFTDNLSISNEVRKPSTTGSFNLIPLAYGFVTYNGSIINATSNVSVTRVSEGVYDITVSGITSACTIITSGGETLTAAYNSTNKCRVTNYQDVYDGFETITKSDTQFYFIIYQP